MGKKKSALKPKNATNRAGHAQVRDDQGNIFILGGYNDSGLLSDIWKYDIDGTWSQCAVKNAVTPLPRVDFAACILNNDIYLFGGVVTNDEEVLILNDLWRYSTSDGVWNCEMSECPVPERGGHVMVAVDATRALIHAGECMKHLDDAWIFDSRTNHFAQVVSSSPAPPPRSSHVAVYNATLNFVAIFGGHTLLQDGEEMTPVYLNDLWILHVDTLSWSFVPFAGLAPSPRDLPAILTLHQHVYILGGYGYAEESDEDDEENAEAEEEEGVVEMNAVAPAEASEEISAEVANLKIADPTASPSTSEAAPLPSTSVVEEDADDDSVTMTYLNDIWIIDVHTHETSELDAVLANGKRGCHMTRLDTGKIIAFGGFNGDKFFGLDASIHMSDLMSINAGVELAGSEMK